MNDGLFKPYNREEILEALKPFFLLGMSITKACETSGICDDQTILNWIKEDRTIRARITGWQNDTSREARKVWKEKIKQGDYQAAKDWLDRKERDEFSTRSEVENSGLIKLEPDLSKLSDAELEQLKQLTDKTTNPS